MLKKYKIESTPTIFVNEKNIQINDYNLKLQKKLYFKFKQLDITGFKFFSENKILIEDGLTGIVGPNLWKIKYCQALRWCMGKNLQNEGDGMEDVIFSGTSNRPQKISEVSLFLDNENKEGSAQFKEFDEATVKRKIEDKGQQ